MPLQAPNSIARQLPAPHNHREQLTVTQGNAAHAGRQGEGEKKEKTSASAQLFRVSATSPTGKKNPWGWSTHSKEEEGLILSRW